MKIIQIEQALRAIDGATFQRLCDAILYRRGYHSIEAVGTVVGKNKVAKGTPDTVITLSNGHYIFVEYTTQEKDVGAKLLGDLSKCLDPEKTGVPIEKVEEVILCHTSRLSPEDDNALADLCQQNGCRLKVFGLSAIAHALTLEFPGLAKEYLGIEIDTGQILEADDFVRAYGQSALATPLDTGFHFREGELQRVAEALDEGDLVLITGRPGVGKSRLALECAERFRAVHPEYSIRCIYNRGVDLYEDIRVHFAPAGQYLILVDDANRLTAFEHILQLLRERREDRKVKVIATVRDYAIDMVRETVHPYGDATEVELRAFSDEQIRNLVRTETPVLNPYFVQRIAEIARGNPRLALMAARVAVEEKTLDSIRDASSLYDIYFGSIRQDLAELQDSDLIKVAGVIAFYRVVDRLNEELLQEIERAFSITTDSFWAAATRLHELEVLDMYEGEVVKFSDQVLSTYLFHTAVFKERTLPLAVLLGPDFFPRYRSRLVDALRPVVETFASESLHEDIRQHVGDAWRERKAIGDDEGLLHLIDVFATIKPTDTLLQVGEWIAELEAEPADPITGEIKPDPNVPSPSILSVLSGFGHVEEPVARMALNLILDYLGKRPGELARVLHVLTEDFGFRHTSHIRGYEIERAVVDVLWERAENGRNERFARLFLAVAEKYLRTEFHRTEMKRELTVTLMHVSLIRTPELDDLRRMIWERLFVLFGLPAFRDTVVEIIHRYSKSGHDISDEDIIESDAGVLLPFVHDSLAPERYQEARAALDYLDFLARHGVAVDDTLREAFRTDLIQISELLLNNRHERLEMGWREYREHKRERMRAHFAGFDLADYRRFFEQCVVIRARIGDGHEKYQFETGLTDVLRLLAEENAELYASVLKDVLWNGNPLGIKSGALVRELVEACGVERAYQIVARPDYPGRTGWLFQFFQALPAEKVTEAQIRELYTLYETAQAEELPHDMDFLRAYAGIDPGVIPNVTEILVRRAEVDANIAWGLHDLFNPHSDVNEELATVFSEHVGLLKRAYFAVLELRDHADHEGTAFNAILDLDPEFAREYVDWLYATRGRRLWRAGDRDFGFVWKRPDHVEVMRRVVEQAWEIENQEPYLWTRPLASFFRTTRGDETDPATRAIQDTFLSALICERGHDGDFMAFLFEIIRDFSPDRRRKFIALFLEQNRRYEDFQRLPMEPRIQTATGSWVPVLRRQADFLESLLPLLNSVALLRHRQLIERRLEDLRGRIESEKKRDFMGW